jgi:hypothetical protein
MQLRRLVMAVGVAAAIGFAVPAIAAPAAAKPKNATAKCTDGTYSTAKTHTGACSGHGGVATWYKEPKDDAKDSKADAKVAAKADAKASKSTTKTAVPPPAPRSTSAAPAPTESKISARPAGSPADATAQCNDGTYSFAKQHSGACSSHKGVKAWFK